MDKSIERDGRKFLKFETEHGRVFVETVEAFFSPELEVEAPKPARRIEQTPFLKMGFPISLSCRKRR